jgi:hypothetical protein
MRPAKIVIPASIAELQDTLKTCYQQNQKVKCIGAGHSFSSVAVVDDDGILISLERMNNILAHDATSVTVEAGCTLTQLVNYLKKHGKQLPACPEYGPFFAGAFSGTQLHESAGNIRRIPTLSSHVLRYRVVKADGTLEIVESDLEFWRNNQGNAGVVVEATFNIMPLDKVLVEYDILSFDEFWPQRDTVPEQYDEFFTIYIPLLDSFFIEKRKYTDQFPHSPYFAFKKNYGSFLRKSVMIRSMPWFYAMIQHLPSYRLQQGVVNVGVNTFFRWMFTNKIFFSEGADRALAFRERPTEIYNDYLYDATHYPAALEELREFLLQDKKLSAATLVASYAVPKDEHCLFSRTLKANGYSIDPVLYDAFGSKAHIRLQNKVQALAKKYHARPHLNKVTNLTAEAIAAGYDQKVICDYLAWCHKMDEKGIFQGDFYRMLVAAAKGKE